MARCSLLWLSSPVITSRHRPFVPSYMEVSAPLSQNTLPMGTEEDQGDAEQDTDVGEECQRVGQFAYAHGQ